MNFVSANGVFGRIAILVIAALALAGCEKYSWHQKIVLEVETPRGVVTGGSVVEVTTRWYSEAERFASANSMSSDKRGEASFVEVAPGRYLFAPHSSNNYGLAIGTFREGKETPREIAARLAKLHETRPVPRKLWPMLVTFTDIGEPMTVRQVDPDNLAATFGRGYRLKSVSLQITDERVTRGKVGQVLPWLADYYGRKLDGRKTRTSEAINELANTLTGPSFDTELN